MTTKETQPGTPKMYVIEVGPIVTFDFSKAEIAAMENDLRKQLDKAARYVMQVGPRSKVVKTRIVEADEC